MSSSKVTRHLIRMHAVAVAILVCSTGSAWAADGISLKASARVLGVSSSLGEEGPLASAGHLDGKASPLATERVLSEAGLRAVGNGLVVDAEVREDRLRAGGVWRSEAAFKAREAYFAKDTGEGRITVGRKVLSWDVGYAFRPNDFVQAAERRGLVDATLTGVDSVQWESFGEDWSASVVGFRSKVGEQRVALDRYDESALAVRLYRSTAWGDLFGFAKLGEYSKASVGASFTAVYGESVAFHGSARYFQRAQAVSISADGGRIVETDPVVVGQRGATGQALIGVSWTGSVQTSVIAEAWFDGLAPSRSFWRTWNERNALLVRAGETAPVPALAGAAAGNLRWQASALRLQSLQRANLFVRLAQGFEQQEISTDLLVWPEDGSGVVTFRATGSIAGVKLELGARRFVGQQGSIGKQLGTASSVFLNLSAKI